MTTDKSPRKTLRETARTYETAPEDASPPGRTVTVRELKARASEILHELERTGEAALITRRGVPWGHLVPIVPTSPANGPKRTLRNAYAQLPDVSDKDFQAAKSLWQPSEDDLQ